LGELLRAALESSESQEVTLRQELEFLKRYLELEQIRFGSRLAVTIDAPPDTLDGQVPNLIMQPLVENAVRHGIEPHSRPGLIELRAQRTDDELTLEVRDNGDGLHGNGPPRDGVGLANTRARLQALYGDAQEFSLGTAPGGGSLVRLTIPFRTDKNSHESTNPDR
jgi:two-component system, LytTR family, sensor kinase